MKTFTCSKTKKTYIHTFQIPNLKLYMKVLLLLTGFVACFFLSTSSQDKCNVKFGKISPSDFDLSKQNIDTAANAVIIADIGNSAFEGNMKGYFSIVFKKQMRIKILNKSGMDAATFEIPLYNSDLSSNGEEKLDNLKAYTYNLENGKVIETKLENGQVFKDKLSKNWSVKKFTMPAVKEGSIIDVTYTIYSDFLFNLQPWSFQGKYPRLWSEYQTNIPEYFNYVTIAQGYTPFHIKSTSQSQSTFNITMQNGSQASDHASLTGMVYISRWVMKDVPALKREIFTTTLDNHISKLEFQLSMTKFPNSPVQPVMASWNKVSEDMMKNENFGYQLYRNNNWLDEEMKKITAGAKDSLDKMKRIYAYVRDNFACTAHSGIYLTDGSLKTVMKNKSGNVADINLLLIAMLSHEGFKVYPTLLSTRSHGYTHAIYPLMDRFNYVVACVMLPEGQLLLDASEPLLGFGRLNEECYNGHARVLTPNTEPIYLEADSVKEQKITNVFMTTDSKGKLQGSMNTTLGYFESLALREVIKEKGKSEFVKKVKSSYGTEWSVDSVVIDSLKELNEPVTVHYDFNFNNNTDDIVYINPMLNEATKENPFTAAERNYPVEMPCTFDEVYVLTLDLTNGYVVDEIPKSTKVLFNDGEGYFEYLVSQNENIVQMRSRMYFNKTNYLPDEYESLRGFFGLVVKKQSEQIVLKKKK